MSAPQVLIVSEATDATVDYLVPHLERAGLSWSRWDPGCVPTRSCAGMALREGAWSSFAVVDEDGARFDLGEVGVVWYRRPSDAHAPASTPTQSVVEFINRETIWFLANLWECLGRPIVNDPYLNLRASLKAHQLHVAHAIGFEVPPTYMGNEPDAIRQLFRAAGGSLVVKGYDPRSVRLADDAERAIYTSLVDEGDLQDDAVLRACPSIWQAYVPKRVEIRVTVVGNAILAAEIHSQASDRSKHDWRIYDLENTPYLPHELPEPLAERCRRLVRELRLFYGAIDLVLTPDGRYVFLEINPSGQWAWIEELCGLPIAQAHVRLLKDLASGVFRW